MSYILVILFIFPQSSNILQIEYKDKTICEAVAKTFNGSSVKFSICLPKK